MLIKNALIENSQQPQDIRIEAENYYDALNRNSSVLYSFRNGRIIKTKEIR